MSLQLNTAIDRRGWRASYAQAYRRSSTYRRARARVIRQKAAWLAVSLAFFVFIVLATHAP